MTEDGYTLSSETLDFNPVEEDDAGVEEGGDLGSSIIGVKEIIEVDQNLVPYQGDEDEEEKREEEEATSYLVKQHLR